MSPTGKRFEGRRALVTGASRGIGAAIAQRLAAEGADVAVTARTKDRHPTLPGSLEETASLLAGYGGRAAVIVADMADADDRARIVPEAADALGGPVEILVNNAAAAIYQPLSDYPLRRRRLIFEVNAHGPIDLAQAALPAMLAAGEGWIVNVSSGSARLTDGPPFRAGAMSATIGVYGASKAALNRLTNALAVELYGTGVRINTVEPRAAVHSVGADVHLGDSLPADMYESMEEMVEGTVALCDCDADHTGRVDVSLDLIDERGLTVMGLDGRPHP
ncbi:MAG TPA: SDR family NAD(P)-dependent oxidoreductase [Acidimicrobiia bacterium]|jgi:NAD(P)-dependent dehydrogenase (short-subunit alcohol dehydrogenase family)